MIDRRVCAVTLALVLALSACEATAAPAGSPSIEVPPSPPAAPSPSVPASEAPIATPGATTQPATPTSSPPPAAVLPASIELQFLDRRYVPGSNLTSAAGQVVWSGGPRTSSMIWRYEPGDREPGLVVDLPRRGSTISDVVAGAAGYAFVEVNAAEYGLGGWRIWFVSGPGAKLVELDRGVAYGAGFPPTLAMDDRRIAWAAFDEPASGDISVLRTVPVDDLGTVTTLLEMPVRRGLLWLPALHGDELWYAILHPDWDGSANGDEFHIERLDLTAAAPVPERFPGTDNDFDPAVSDTHVAWKTSIGDGAALNWGTISVEDRRTRARRTVPVTNVNRPTLGTRFLAFEEVTRSRLAVFDLVRGEVVDLLPDDRAGKVHVGGQSVSGSLLAFFTQEGEGAPRIGWALLPE